MPNSHDSSKHEKSFYPQANLGRVDKSVTYGRYTFPTMTDYIHFFLDRGYITKPEELLENDTLIASMQRHWHTRGQNGCVFAQAVADNSALCGWENAVCNKPLGALLEKSHSHRIQRLVNEAVRNPKIQIVSLLFPQILETDELVILIRLLETLSGFSLVTKDYEEFVTVGLRLSLNNDSVTSWIMGFGPFPFLPNTRQSPITEVVIRVKTKSDVIFHRLNQERTLAHLADTPPHIDDDVMEILWRSTYSKARSILGGEPNRFSAAKTTFTIPTEAWYCS